MKSSEKKYFHLDGNLVSASSLKRLYESLIGTASIGITEDQYARPRLSDLNHTTSSKGLMPC